MKKLGTLIAALLVVSGVANAADFTLVHEAKLNNNNTNTESSDDTTSVEWTLAKGYKALNEDWTFTFDIDRDYTTDNDSGGKDSYYGWDTEFGFQKSLGSFDAMDKTWEQDIWFGIEYDESNSLDSTGGANLYDTDYVVSYTAGTDLTERTAMTVELLGRYNKARSDDGSGTKTTRDGDRYEANVYLTTNWNKYWVSDTALYNYLVSYDTSAASADFYVFELEHYTNFTYELPRGLYFNTEFGLESYGNSSATSESLSTTEMWIEPKLGYKYVVDENLSIHSWVGVKAFDAITTDVRDDLDEYHNNKFEAVVGFNYSM